ncbi:MAG: hypothetical protein HMLKMBBP_03388 [Planctomycetes bacterium]|nr:hypothetical protein [Planctomycetota bacterium]
MKPGQPKDAADDPPSGGSNGPAVPSAGRPGADERSAVERSAVERSAVERSAVERSTDERSTDVPRTDDAPESIVDAPSPRKALGFVAFVALCVVLVAFPLRDLAGPEAVHRLRAEVDAFGAWGPVAFVALNAVAVAVGVPRLAFGAAAGALFGWFAGALLAQWGALVGNVVTFAAGRVLGRRHLGQWIAARFPKAGAVLSAVGRHGFSMNILLRWAPVGHSFTTSLLMGVSPCTARDFVLGTFVGLLPYSVVAALFGSAAKGGNWIPRVVGAVAMAVALTLFVGWWVRRRRGRS